MKSYRPIGGSGRSSRNLILAVAGTRPEAIKLAPVLWALQAHDSLRVIVVNSGQHPEAVRTTFSEFQLCCDVELNALPQLPNLRGSFAHLRDEIAAVVKRYRPRCVLVQGDTLSTYAGASAAADEGIPVAHVEAGLRTGSASDPFPEEWIRRRVARMADLHFAPTPAAAAHLRSEGVPASAIFCTGNTGIDSLHWMLGTLRQANTATSASRDCVLITLHRRENYDRNADVVCRALIRLAQARPDLRMLFPVHPNPRVSVPIRRRLGAYSTFSLVAPMSYREFIAAASGAALIVSDSGGIQEEAPHLGTPLLVPRCNTERPEGIATGFVTLVRVDEDVIVGTALAALAAPRRPAVPIDGEAPFGAGDAAHRIVRALETRVMERALA